jgi:hypothetical protein
MPAQGSEQQQSALTAQRLRVAHDEDAVLDHLDRRFQIGKGFSHHGARRFAEDGDGGCQTIAGAVRAMLQPAQGSGELPCVRQGIMGDEDNARAGKAQERKDGQHHWQHVGNGDNVDAVCEA